ncbi:MAG: hypothetical protein O2999_01000 [Nitrospirae bacterium]|nr:hypothetical protein [Nitrospirota bacterium]MDA1302881.1 hypothetical protein [Nitrospirota bacterium]
MKSWIISHSYSIHSSHWFVLTVLGLLFSGCTEPLYWAKSNAQPGEFERDTVACQEALGLPSGGKGGKGVLGFDPTLAGASVAIEQCLADKGWILARKLPR